MTEPTSQYDVGYGKPPRDYRWKPGQSGNPAGRPRKKRSPAHFTDSLVQALLASHDVVIDGVQKKLPAFEIVGYGLIRDLLKAEGRNKIVILRFLERMGVLDQLRWALEEMREESPIFSEEDREFLANLKLGIEAQVKLDPERWADEAGPGRHEGRE